MAKTKGATDRTKRKINENSLKNLTNISEKLTDEQRSEAGKIGGKKSGEVRREKKLMRDIITEFLSLPIKPGDTEEIHSLAESKGKNLTVSEVLTIAQIKKAMGGDTRALEFLRDTAGEKPTEKIQTEVTGMGKLDEILAQLDDPDDKK